MRHVGPSFEIDSNPTKCLLSLNLDRPQATVEEDLFLHVSTGLRKLKKHRKYIRTALETALNPFAQASGNEQAEAIRIEHLELVQQIISSHEDRPELTPVAAHLYWTLYTGVLAFWADDSSPNQEDTLAMLDQSLSMFVNWLQESANVSRQDCEV